MHRVRKGRFWMCLRSSEVNKRMVSTFLAKGHRQVENSSPAFSNFCLKEKWFQPYWQTTNRTLHCGFWSPTSLKKLKGSLGLKVNRTITHPHFKEGSELSPSLFLMKRQNFWCKHSEIRPHVRCYSLSQLLVPEEEATVWVSIRARAKEAMVHLECQCNITIWIKHSQKIKKSSPEIKTLPESQEGGEKKSPKSVIISSSINLGGLTVPSYS